MTPVELSLLAVSVLAGASAQRLTGMGFALVASPLLVLLLGPDTGVTVIQFAGFAAAALVLVGVWRDVDWPVLPWLLVPALIGLAPGVAMVRALSAPVLQIVIGVLVILALAATLASERARVFKGRKGAASAGLLSGFMNAAAGVGGPAVVLYRVSVDWPQRPFVATLQVYFLVLCSATIAARGMPQMAVSGWVAGGVALLVGLVLGDRLAKRVPEHTARMLTVAVAMLGALATVAKGVASL